LPATPLNNEVYTMSSPRLSMSICLYSALAFASSVAMKRVPR